MRSKKYLQSKTEIELDNIESMIQELGINLNEELTEEIEERIDAIWSEFNLNDESDLEEGFHYGMAQKAGAIRVIRKERKY